MICVRKVREKFPIYKNNENLVYLDSAASSLKLESVLKSISYYYENLNVNVYRGVYDLSYEATELYEETREVVANFINAKSEEVIFTKGTTNSINMVANHYLHTLKEGDEIIISELEHHSNFIPWQMVAKKTKAVLRFAKLTKEGKLTVEAFSKVLTNKTKIVALTYASNVMGHITPLKEIIMLSHEKGAKVLVDAAQAVSHVKINVKALNMDYLAFSSHKMFGPTGVGVLYLKKELANDFYPFEFGGEMALRVNKENSTFKEAPYKLEAGTPNISGVIAFKEAINFINEISVSSIYEHVKMIKEYTLKKLSSIEEVEIYNKDSDIGLITFNIKGVHPHDALSIFEKNKVYLRAGQHCAEPITTFLGQVATLRASFHLYNNFDDANKFIEAVYEVIEFFGKF